MATETQLALAAALADGAVRVVDLTQPLSETHAGAAAPAAVREHARPLPRDDQRVRRRRARVGVVRR